MREQRQEGWVPKVGSKVFVPRLGGDAKVRMFFLLNFQLSVCIWRFCLPETYSNCPYRLNCTTLKRNQRSA